jgi:ParB-like nuclease domain
MAQQAHNMTQVDCAAVLSNDHRLELLPVGSLKPSKRNARKHSEKQIQQIAKSIARFGFTNPVLIDDDGQIIAGHGRIEAAKLLKLQKVPVLRLSHLSAVEKKAYVIADNRLAEQAGWDREILALELQELTELDFEVELTGFDIGDIDIVLNDALHQPSSGPQDHPTPLSAVSQRGDVWLLGEHRLTCGDAEPTGFTGDIDVAVRAWQKYTGKSAKLSPTRQSFKDIELQRSVTPAANSGVAQ